VKRSSSCIDWPRSRATESNMSRTGFERRPQNLFYCDERGFRIIGQIGKLFISDHGDSLEIVWCETL
jgi:hypothetical protein